MSTSGFTSQLRRAKETNGMDRRMQEREMHVKEGSRIFQQCLLVLLSYFVKSQFPETPWMLLSYNHRMMSCSLAGRDLVIDSVIACLPDLGLEVEIDELLQG